MKKYSLYYEGLKTIRQSGFYGHDVERVDGRELYVNQKKVIDFSTCGYLGLEQDIQEEDIKHTKLYGLRDGWSRITGASNIVRQLEKKIAEKLGLESCRLGQSISLINGSIFYSLKELFENTFCDADAHFTLKKGVESNYKARRNLFYFKNNDLNFLEGKLKKIESSTSKLIVVDGIYSMKGSFAKINGILDLCEKYNAYLYIDDAHGFGVVGKTGLGVLEKLDVKKLSRIIYVASFSKSCSNPVAFVAANKNIIQCLDNSAPFLIFSGPPSNFHCVISNRHLDSFDSSVYKDKREKIKRYSSKLHGKCKNLGLETFSEKESPIISIKISSRNFNALSDKVFDIGLIGKGVIYPAVRKGDEAMRFTITSKHKQSEIEMLGKVFEVIKEYNNE
ncbi:pyridoxal phosphate-dependent aminotransferase family protein [bacterium]|nr:pyridoxal phosphate-dependent aminotransferase family protein [bacterium]